MKRRVCKKLLITSVIITMILCSGCGLRKEKKPIVAKKEERIFNRYDFKDIWSTLTIDGKNIGFPFDVKIPSSRPVDMSSLSEAELNAELEKGYADIKTGRTRGANAVFADIRKDYNL